MDCSDLLAADSEEEVVCSQSDDTGIDGSAACCAEDLLRMHLTATTQEQRDLIASQLARIGGPYRSLVRGMPFSVWVRYAEFNDAIVKETAEALERRWSQLVEKRIRRQRGGAAGSSSEAARSDVLISPKKAMRVIGSRSPLPRVHLACSSSSRQNSSTRVERSVSVVESPLERIAPHGTHQHRVDHVDDGEEEDDDFCIPRLSAGEAMAVSLLALDEPVTHSPGSIASYRVVKDHNGEYTSELVPESSPTTAASPYSPFSIFDSDDEQREDVSPSPPVHTRVSGASQRHLAEEEMGASRRLFDSSDYYDDTDETAPLPSLAGRVVEGMRRKEFQKWMASSQDGLSLSY